MQSKTTTIVNQGNSVTQRELEVLKLIAFEYTTTEISQCLYISKHTVDTHRKHLMQKLKVRKTAGMIRRGFELKYLSV